jgi:hypothetical protein
MLIEVRDHQRSTGLELQPDIVAWRDVTVPFLNSVYDAVPVVRWVHSCEQLLTLKAGRVTPENFPESRKALLHVKGR